MVVHPTSRKVPRAPRYSGFLPTQFPFIYATLTLFGMLSQTFQLENFRLMQVLYPDNPKIIGLGSSPFARRYLGNLG